MSRLIRGTVGDVSYSVHVIYVLASIPSPSFNQLDLGPLSLSLYGLMIALGALAAIGIAERRWAARGGDPEDIASIATWAIAAGVVGARI